MGYAPPFWREGGRHTQSLGFLIAGIWEETWISFLRDKDNGHFLILEVSVH